MRRSSGDSDSSRTRLSKRTNSTSTERCCARTCDAPPRNAGRFSSRPRVSRKKCAAPEPNDVADDLGGIVGVLADGGVEVILIGGLATQAHGSARLTQDADFVYGRSDANIARLAKTPITGPVAAARGSRAAASDPTRAPRRAARRS